MREGFSLGRDLINHGTLAPGLQLGAITVPNYFQFSDGTLDINLAGTTRRHRIRSNRDDERSLPGGQFNVCRFVSSFTPLAGNTFTVLTAASITGKFTTFDLPQLTAGLVWNISKTTTAIRLRSSRPTTITMASWTWPTMLLWRNNDGIASVTPYSGRRQRRRRRQRRGLTHLAEQFRQRAGNSQRGRFGKPGRGGRAGTGERCSLRCAAFCRSSRIAAAGQHFGRGKSA